MTWLVYLDNVPLSGIIRIRDMMYSVQRSFPPRSGRRQLRLARHREVGDGSGDCREQDALRPDRPVVPRLRELIAAKLRDKNRIPIEDPEDVLVTNGGIHGLYIVCHALLDPGDEVLVPDPEWPPTAGNMRSRAGCRSPCRLHEALGWRYDLDELESKITPKTRVLYLNSPQQPDRWRPDPSRPRAAGGDRARARPVGDFRRGLRGRRLRWRARQHRVAAGDVRANDPALHVQQVVRDDRAAARLRRHQGHEAMRDRAKKMLFYTTSNIASVVQFGGIGALEGPQDCIEEFRDGAAGAARSVLQRPRASWRATSSRGSRLPARSTPSCASIRAGATASEPGPGRQAGERRMDRCPGGWSST